MNTKATSKDIFSTYIASGPAGALRHLATDGDVNSQDKMGRTLLMYAVIDRKPYLLKQLVVLGGNVNQQDNQGWSALHFAAHNYDVEAARNLIAAGAAVDVQDSHGNSPLVRAIFNSNGRGEVIELFLSKGANPQLKNKHDQTPVGLAKLIANFDVTKFFPESSSSE